MIRRRRKHRFVAQMAATSPRGLFPIFLWTNRAKPLIIKAKMWRQPACPNRICKVMRSASIIAPVLAAAALSACVSATSVPSYQQKEDEYVPFAAAILTIAADPEIGGPTHPDNIGNAGPIYNGIIHASLDYTNYDPETGQYSGIPNCTTCSFGGSGPLTEYLAELQLVIENFGSLTPTLSGNLSSFFTPLAGFKNPNGTITLVGSVSKTGTSADIDFSGTGTLTGSGMTASFEIFDVYGGFGGADGEIMVGGFLSNFDWLTGTYAGSTSEADGLWVAQEQ